MVQTEWNSSKQQTQLIPTSKILLEVYEHPKETPKKMNDGWFQK